MAKFLTAKQQYRQKTEWLSIYFEEVSPLEFYRAMFPVGSFERSGYFEDGKANGILTVIEEDHAHNLVVFDDLEEIQEVLGQEFVIMSPVSYVGRNRTAINAQWLYGIAIDLDGVALQNLIDLFHQMDNEIIPRCTYCVNSGHGLHLYYLFEKPVPLYRHLKSKLKEFKYELITKIWNRYTSYYKEREHVQYQGIFQGFRMVGTQSKLGKRYPVRAFLTGEKVTIEYLNEFLIDKSKAVTDFKYQSDLTLADAKLKYPEWYEKRIVKKERAGRWHVKRDLYDWWLEKIQRGASLGHRYNCLSVLAAYGIKCDVPEEEVLSDALSLLPYFDGLSNGDEHKRFTKKDVLDAMKFYHEDFVTYSRKEAERVSAIPISPNKRNGRKQVVHLERARAVQNIDYPDGKWRNLNGRPQGHTTEHIVQEWQLAHPDGRKVDCCRETGLSKPTVIKWWREPEEVRPIIRGNKAQIVEQWQQEHPDGRQVDCVQDTGLSKPTVRKWWQEPEEVRPSVRENKSQIVEQWQQEHPDGSQTLCHYQTGLCLQTIRKWWKEQG